MTKREKVDPKNVVIASILAIGVLAFFIVAFLFPKPVSIESIEKAGSVKEVIDVIRVGEVDVTVEKNKMSIFNEGGEEIASKKLSAGMENTAAVALDEKRFVVFSGNRGLAPIYKVEQNDKKSKPVILYTGESFAYTGNVTGATMIDDKIALVDGTDTIRLLNAKNFDELKPLKVGFTDEKDKKKEKQKIDIYNLAYGENVFYALRMNKNEILEIDAKTGEVIGIRNVDFIIEQEKKEADKVISAIRGISVVGKKTVKIIGNNWTNYYYLKFK